MNCCWLHYSAISLLYSFRGCGGKAPEKPIVKQQCSCCIYSSLFWFLLDSCEMVVLWYFEEQGKRGMGFKPGIRKLLQSCILFLCLFSCWNLHSWVQSHLAWAFFPQKKLLLSPPPNCSPFSISNYFQESSFFPLPFRIQLCTAAAIIICIAHHFSPLCSSLCVMSNISHSFSLKA